MLDTLQGNVCACVESNLQQSAASPGAWHGYKQRLIARISLLQVVQKMPHTCSKLQVHPQYVPQQ